MSNSIVLADLLPDYLRDFRDVVSELQAIYQGFPMEEDEDELVYLEPELKALIERYQIAPEGVEYPDISFKHDIVGMECWYNRIGIVTLHSRIWWNPIDEYWREFAVRFEKARLQLGTDSELFCYQNDETYPPKDLLFHWIHDRM